MRLVFGREPALWLSFIAATVAAIGAFIIHFSSEQEGAINAVAFGLMGLITAFIVHDGISAAILGFFKVLIALGISFGMHIDSPRQAILMALVAAWTAMFVRTQVVAPVPPLPPGT